MDEKLTALLSLQSRRTSEGNAKVIESEAKELLDKFISSWLRQDIDVFLGLLSDDVVYTESYGPVYSNKTECEKWFEEWNKDSKVLQWTIDGFFFDRRCGRIIFQWFFECDYKGTIANFNGSSFIVVSDNLITSVTEYKTESEHSYPYKAVDQEIKPDREKPQKCEYKIENAWPDGTDLALLFNQTSWAQNRKESDVSLLVDNADIVASVYDGSRLIGFGRIITDGRYRGLLDDIIVDGQYRSKGVGTAIVKALLEKAGEIEEIFLHTGKEHQAFYERTGFAPFVGTTMVKGNNRSR